MRAVRPAIAAATLAAVALLASCTPVAPAWQRVSLPDGVQPSVLEPAGEVLLVGGQDDDSRPVLLSLDGAGNATRLALAGSDPHATASEVVAVSAAGHSLTALSVTRSGAHGSQRWTVWEGSAAGLADQPQEFFTFGGHDAGPLLALARAAGEPVILGTHGGDPGFEADLWTRSGATWSRHPATDPDVADDGERVLVFRSATAAGDRLLLAGAVVDLTGGVRQTPALWSGDTSGRWERIGLPVPGTSDPAGSLAQATSVMCPHDLAGACWAAGWVRGQPVAWQVPHDGEPTAWALPGVVPAGQDPLAQVTLTASGPLVAPNATDGGVAWFCAGRWWTGSAPATPVRALGSWLGDAYAITGTDSARSLWRADTPGC